MTTQEEYHKALHEKIHAATMLSDWIYADVRLNCDDQAGERTVERLNGIEEQHGIGTIYGIAACWAIKAALRIESAMAQSGAAMPALKATLEEGIVVSELDDTGRAAASALQFCAAVGNDDLEMGEAIFNAAASGDRMDLMQFLDATLTLCINMSNQAKGEF